MNPDRAAGSGAQLTSRPVRTYLLAMVLVPLIGTGSLAGSVVRDRAATADAAVRVEAVAGRIGDLADLRAALIREAFATETVVATEKVGIGVEAAGRLAGRNLRAELADHRHDTDAVVASGDGRVVDAAAIDDARVRSGSAAPSDTIFSAPYTQLVDRIDRASGDLVAEVGPATHDLAATDIVDALAAVRDEGRLLDSFVSQFSAQALLLEGRPRPPLVNQLVAATTEERRILDDLAGSSDEAVATAVGELDHDPDTQVTREATRAGIGGTSPTLADGPVAWKQAVDVVNANIETLEATFRLVEATTSSLRHTAGALATHAVGDLHRWATFAGGIAVASVAVALLLARAIADPLHRLGERAMTVSGGDLSGDDLPPRGPRDIAVTALAFNDLVGNLRVLDAKARALAACDLDSPALSEPLPGPLGRALERSAELLSGSLEERDLLRRHILDQAGRDALTGLRNRLSVGDLVRRAAFQARARGVDLAVLIFDVDGFKRINDVHGHAVGDAVLRQLAQRLATVTDDADVIGRLGNDELVLVREGVGQPGDAVELALTVLAAFDGAPLEDEARGLLVTASVGIALSHTVDGDALLMSADLALARAKTRAGRAVELYDRDLQDRLDEQVRTERALRDALADDELFLVFQPVVDLDGLNPTSVEALIRWDRPGMGLQPPDSFIPIAEASDLIIDIDRWVLQRALEQVRQWQDDPALAHLDMAVNISGRHLRSRSLVHHVTEALDNTGVDPRRLIIEITETVLVDDLGPAADQLHAVRALGVRVAIDDFGTGFASIAHLQHLPADVLKLDRSFVSQVRTARERALLALMADVGHHLGLAVTAEGVETAEELQALQEIGCDHAQGYLLSRPTAPEAVAEWTRSQAAVPQAAMSGDER